MNFSRYVLVTRDDHELAGAFTDFEEAKAAAETSDCAVVEQIFEYSDSELIWTPDGSDVWPPEKEPT